ncbi:E3 ubiquitin-protein ligase SDIR1 [Apostasia shenzhenica]|uniref:E3 ubiquitin-protein ligase SDIR1 n=1 Tax=Apostasia shenzhenica TaxID=1088818 RepID=A0A2H9ZSF2_9ASPA|nr:E3 ubiquitin-protein ligase SDIR1 [Apostasia shenzhenica]
MCNLNRVDSDMVLEVPDTPDRIAFVRSVDESSLDTYTIEDTPSSSSQYLEPATSRCSYTPRNFNLCDLKDNTAQAMDTDFLFSQARLARLISEAPRTKPSHVCSSPELEQSSVLNYRGRNQETVDLSQESPFPISHPTRCRGPRFKVEKHPSKQNEGNQSNLHVGHHISRASVSTKGIGKERNNGVNLFKSFPSTSNVDESGKVERCVVVASKGNENIFVEQKNSRNRKEPMLLGPSQFGLPQVDNYQNDLVVNDCTSYSDDTRVNSSYKAEVCFQGPQNSVNSKPCSLNGKKDNATGEGPCKESPSTSRQTNHILLESGVRPKIAGHRRLVHNGCISPSNIARYKSNVKTKGIDEGITASGKLSMSNLPQPIQINSPVSEGRMINKGKGKALPDDDSLISGSSCLMPDKEVTVISDMDYGTGSVGDNGWVTTCRHTGNLSLSPSSYSSYFSVSENHTSHLSVPRDETTYFSRRRSTSIQDKHEGSTLHSRANIRQQCCAVDSEVLHHTGKRKISSSHSNAVECSSRPAHSPKIPKESSSGKPTHSRSTRSHRIVRDDVPLAPIIEVDELESNNPRENCGIESIVRARQVESDEILARQLQEQFYLESPPLGATEDDSAIFRSFLQEDNDGPTSTRRLNQSQRETVVPVLSARPRFQHSAARTTTRARTANRIAQLRRSTYRHRMSLEVRLDFLEALEAAIENGNNRVDPDSFFRVHRDFNESDYELLLALDENNHHHVGASERQINCLPQSVIQNDGSEEACAVCLETPTVGDTIRHLPCLHKFHKDCIDTWLRRKRSCPICKCGIT